MLRKIQIRFEYDGTTQGDLDRDSFKATWDSEVVKATVVPTVTHGVNVETSGATVNGNIVSGLVFYTSNNAGTTDWSTFWSAIELEWAKTTIVTANSSGQKHDCYHDSFGSCLNFVYLT